MICDGDLGPGQNIVFFLVTTGLDVLPSNGTIGSENYEYLKTIISEGAEILYEAPALRQIPNVSFSRYLDAYDNSPRTLYQALFGVARYSNPWNRTSLTQAIENSTLFPKLMPDEGQYSLNPYEFYDKGFALYQCVEVAPSVLGWLPMNDFKITEKMPGINDGFSKSVWGVLQNNQMEIYVKNAFSWTALEEYVSLQNSSIVVSKNEPSKSLNKFWFKVDDVTVYEYTDNHWAMGETALFQTALTGGSADNDKIFRYNNSCFILYNYVGGKYKKNYLSQYINRDKNLNSTFRSNSVENFIIEDDCIALLGGIVSHLFDEDTSMLKVYHDGVFVGEYVGLDFKNVDVAESVTLPNVAEIIHTQPSNSNLALTNIILSVSSDNQTVFSVPNDMKELVEIDVNGVTSTAFTFDMTSHTLTFNPVLAGYQLDQYDELVVTYFY